MRRYKCLTAWTVGLLALVWSASAAQGQAPATPQTPQVPSTPAEQQPTSTPQANAETGQNNQFAQAPAAGTEAAGGFDTAMIGDQVGILVQRCVPVPHTFTRTFPILLGCNFTYIPIPLDPAPPIVLFAPAKNGVCTPPPPPQGYMLSSLPPTQVMGTQTQTFTEIEQVCQDILLATRGGFRIGENESPQPQDRVFFDYNYYGSARTGIDALGNVANGNINREMFGFEKTFLDGDASIGLRAPVLQAQGDGGFGQNDFGDLTIVTKFAPLYDHATGDLLSFGLAVTAPTGPALVTTDFTVHDWLLQPWTGFFLSLDRWYLEGFSSIAVPTDSRDVTIWFNDLSVGYRLYRGSSGSLLSGIIPTMEVHVTTPLDHRGANQLITVPDFVDLTFGAHLELFNRSILTVGVNTPVTGPHLYGVEGIAYLTFRF